MDMVVVTVLGGPKRPDPRGFAKGGGTKDHDERLSDLSNFSISPSDLLDINVLDLYREFWEWERLNGNGHGAGAGISFDAESASSPLATSAHDAPTYMDLTNLVSPRRRDFDRILLCSGSSKHGIHRRTQDSGVCSDHANRAGPSRGVVLRGPRAFEIDLKVKGNGTPSEGEALCHNAFIYNNLADYGKYGQARTVVVPSKHNTIEVRLAHLKDTVEATITIYVMEKQAFCALFTAHTKSIDDRMVLLDSRGCEVAVDETGQVKLQLGIVTVEESGGLVVGVRAARDHAAMESGHFVEKQLDFEPRCGLRSEDQFDIGFNKVHVVVAWSLL
ncbi:hypothetical protein ACQ4PT_024807 [Festuca glaucescens]